METPVEIRYAGVVVARAEQVRSAPVGKDGEGYFIAMPEPLPVGTLITVGELEARIEKVVESADAAEAGIYVRRVAAGEASRPWVPAAVEETVPEPRHVARPESSRRNPTIVVAAPPTAPLEEQRPAEARQHNGGGDGEERGGAVMMAAPARADEYRARTIVVAAPEPTVPRGAAGEIDVRTPTIVVPAAPAPSVSAHATIVVDGEAEETTDGVGASAPPEETAANDHPGDRATAAYPASAADLPPARPLPPDARRRNTRRRRTTNTR